jgi:TetR/AcrR family transcriptional regulator, repressor for uid operon
MSTTASRRPGRPPAAKTDETRKRIVQAAREVFGERGYDGATFQAIAVRAELTRPALNHYFSSKRVLYREVVDQTNELVVAAGMERAQREATLMGRLTAFLYNAKCANIENPSASAFMVTAALESRRHQELNRAEHVSVPTSRDFLTWVVNDAIERGEIATDIDASTLVETLLVVLCGVGLYAGYLRTYQKMEAVVEMLRRLLEGALWQPTS